ncbi:hypothetical protein [Sciscionella sediminilitoris]|uniref:hypothetical protein n=1 Tax=Sciscionella sediminilitoris TaxID=1445613 RepID=UPI0004DF7000|nr:hypothetical protein [Sciscionella sp. SE31]
MPIRTNRGRAAVYRKVWGWPLRSPAHLVGAVLIVAVVAVAIGISIARAGGNDTGRKPEQQQGPVAAPSVQVSQPSMDVSALPDRITETSPPASAPPDPHAIAVAEQWAKAWVNHPQGVTSQQWLAGLKPFTTPEYLSQMQSIDPANVPASKVTGPGKAAQSYAASVNVTVPTDGGELRITVIKAPQGWLVADYDKG